MDDTSHIAGWENLAPMPLSRAGCAVANLNGRILVAGGTYWRDGKKFWCDRFDGFDPAKNAWTSLPVLPRLAGDAAGVACGNEFVVVGGGGSERGSSSVLAWRDTGWSSWHDLPAGRRSTASVWHDGELFVFGGLSGGPTEFNTATPTMWSCRPGAAWTTRRPIPGPPRFNCAIGSVGPLIVLAGGCTAIEGGVRNLDDVLAYDPRTDAWTQVAQLPFPCRGSWGVSDGRSLLIVGGYSDHFCTHILEWDAQRGSIIPRRNLPVALADARFVRWNDTLIGLSGEDGVQRRFGDTIRIALERL